MLDDQQGLAVRGGVAPELVRHDHRGTSRKTFSSLRKNRLAAVALRGVALVVAVTVVAEVGDFRRFANAR
jgi:hypothetical protein